MSGSTTKRTIYTVSPSRTGFTRDHASKFSERTLGGGVTVKQLDRGAHEAALSAARKVLKSRASENR